MMFSYLVLVSFDHFRAGQTFEIDADLDWLVRAGYLREVDRAVLDTVGADLRPVPGKPVGRRRKKVNDGPDGDLPGGDQADGFGEGPGADDPA